MIFFIGLAMLLAGLVLSRERKTFCFYRYYGGCALQFLGAVAVLSVPMMEFMR